MSKKSVSRTLEHITVAELARQLNVTHRAVAKCKETKYFPADWFQRITILTNGAVTYDDLYSDLYFHKYHIVPEVLLKAIYKFAKLCSKKSTPVTKSQQKRAG